MNIVLGWLMSFMGAAIVMSGVTRQNFFDEFGKVLGDPISSVTPSKGGPSRAQITNMHSEIHPVSVKEAVATVGPEILVA
jgi:hypothetical protein